MRGGHHRVEREMNPGRWRKQGGADFSSTAQFGQLTSPASLRQRPAPLQLCGCHCSVKHGSSQRSAVGMWLILPSGACWLQTHSSPPRPKPWLPCTYHPRPIPLLVSVSLARRLPPAQCLPTAKEGRVEGEFAALCGLHPACVLVFYFIFMSNLHCLLGLGLK